MLLAVGRPARQGSLALSTVFVSFEAQKRMKMGYDTVFSEYTLGIVPGLPIAWSYFKSFGEMYSGFSAVSFYSEATGASAPLTPLFAGKAINETQTRSTSAEKAKLNLRHAPLILVPS